MGVLGQHTGIDQPPHRHVGTGTRRVELDPGEQADASNLADDGIVDPAQPLQQMGAGLRRTLALPPGPIGWLTIVPELVAIWRIQRLMVADIAAVYGVGADLTRSHMLYCLFRHAAAQALRDVGVQVGARLLIQDLPLRLIEKIAAKIGVSLSRRLVGRGITRWLPEWKKRDWRTADRKPVKNVDLWQRLEKAIENHRVEWHWVRGHSGHVENERVDQLARDAIKALRQSDRA